VTSTNIIINGEGGWLWCKDGGDTAPAGTPATMVVKTITLSDGTTMLVYAPAP